MTVNWQLISQITRSALLAITDLPHLPHFPHAITYLIERWEVKRPGSNTVKNFKMAAGEAVELSQLQIPHLENLRSQLEEVAFSVPYN